MPAVHGQWLDSAQARHHLVQQASCCYRYSPTRGITHEAKRLFKYTAACTVDSVLPSRGAMSGGTRLLVGGCTFMASLLLCVLDSSCRSGRELTSQQSNASHLPTHWAQCWSKCHLHMERRAGSALFVFENITVLSVQPRQGPVNGGTTLVVWGGNFGSIPAATCMFGHGFRSAARVAMSRLECTAPPSAVGTVALYIVATGGELFVPAPSFEYQAAARIFVASPFTSGWSTLVQVHGWTSRAERPPVPRWLWVQSHHRQCDVRGPNESFV